VSTALRDDSDGVRLREGPGAALRAWVDTIDKDSPSSTYQGSYEVPFQRWFKFKEAFSPLLVKNLLERSPIEVRKCLDVFGGCGTTGLTSLFMGIQPTIIEVNPFLADVIRAKLAHYEVDRVMRAYLRWHETALLRFRRGVEVPSCLPLTFVEKKGQQRWLYSHDVMERIESYRLALADVRDPDIRRLFRVLLGASLVELSNVLVNGKGRRYRQSWESMQKSPRDVDRALDAKVTDVIYDLTRFQQRPNLPSEVIHGDARQMLRGTSRVDAVVTSPPYPNSFDYTDIYNLELWVLGYIRARRSETKLRLAAVRSHVQRQLPHSECDVASPTLARVRAKLNKARAELWSAQIPDMVESYFADLAGILEGLKSKVTEGGRVSMIVADSAYASIPVRVGQILGEIGEQLGYDDVDVSTLRQIKSSAQQGWKRSLREEIVTFTLPRRPRRAS
jgi:hypothetical protein